MGIFDELFGKHGHRKDNVVQELLEIIKKQQEEAILSEKNEARLIAEANQAERNEERLIRENQRLLRQLERCHRQHPHGARFDVVF